MGWRLLIAVWLMGLQAFVRPAGESRQEGGWTRTWYAAQQWVDPSIAPPAPGLAQCTLRQVVRITVGGQQVRVVFSNEYGKQPLTIEAAHLARAIGRGEIAAGSDRKLLFAGQPSVTIPPGGEAKTDPLRFEAGPGSDLAISIRLGDIEPEGITTHPGARCTSFAVPGDALSSPHLPTAVTSEHWYYLTAVEVDGASDGVLAVMGDSLTDGRGSTTDGNGRWTDALRRRMEQDPAARNIAVFNAGIGGNRVLHRERGPSARERFERDVLHQPGAKWVILFEGVNDLGTVKPQDADRTADELIAAYREMIAKGRNKGLKVYGATITPFGGSFYDAPEREAARQKLNRFIRSADAFDGVVDLDAAVRDPAAPTRLRAEFDTGDHLHLNDAGYRQFASAVDLKLFTN